MSGYAWPPALPADCPPPDAVAAGGRVFRLVDADPPGRDDFLPAAVASPGRQFEGNECISFGLSVYLARDDAEATRDRYKGFRGKAVAEGWLEPRMGKTHRTPTQSAPSHVTWWLYEGLVHDHYGCTG